MALTGRVIETSQTDDLVLRTGYGFVQGFQIRTH